MGEMYMDKAVQKIVQSKNVLVNTTQRHNKLVKLDSEISKMIEVYIKYLYIITNSKILDLFHYVG